MQQKIHPAKGPIHAKVILPGSKSITNRALLLAALADGVSEISGMQIDDDIRAFVHALSQLGIVTQLDEKTQSCIVAGCNGKLPKKQVTVWCGSGETIARFLLAACSATAGVYYFDASPDLSHKVITHLLEVLLRQGAQLIPSDAKKMPFTLIGADGLQGGSLTFDSEMSTQIASALLIVAPFAHSPFTFTMPNAITQPYIEMTCAMMAEFGVLVHRIHQGQFMVPVPQHYWAVDYAVEPDLAIAAYFFAAASVTAGDVTIQPIKRSASKQRDIKFLSVLEKMGCQIVENRNGLTIKGAAELQGIEVSMKDFTDTFLALAAIAPFAKSPTRIAHIGHISPRESKRLSILHTEFEKLGVRAEAGPDWIKIFPSTPRAGVVDSHNDHRIAMAFSIIGLKVPGIVIEHADCVSKFHPEFFSLWDKLSEKIDISA